MPMLIKGAKGRRGRRGQMADINVTPMVDVMLVLLVVFMVTAPMLATGVSVSLPKVTAEQMPTENQRPLVITIDKDGSVYLGMEDTAVELKDLAPQLMALAENNIEKRVYVRADEMVANGVVVKVLALLQTAGFRNVGLPVDPNVARRIMQGG
jgi:biopolymer transport protein TolR